MSDDFLSKEDLIKFDYEKKIAMDKIEREKKRLHDAFAFKYKRLLFCFDLLFVLIILMNMGAVFITNFMVVQKNPAILSELKEVNPVQTKINPNLVEHPRSKQIFTGVIKQLLFWTAMIFCYVYYRRTIYSEATFTAMIIILVVYFAFLGWDFSNDLGFFVSRWFV